MIHWHTHTSTSAEKMHSFSFFSIPCFRTHRPPPPQSQQLIPPLSLWLSLLPSKRTATPHAKPQAPLFYNSDHNKQRSSSHTTCSPLFFPQLHGLSLLDSQSREGSTCFQTLCPIFSLPSLFPNSQERVRAASTGTPSHKLRVTSSSRKSASRAAGSPKRTPPRGVCRASSRWGTHTLDGRPPCRPLLPPPSADIPRTCRTDTVSDFFEQNTLDTHPRRPSHRESRLW